MMLLCEDSALRNMYARSHEYLVSGEKGVEDAKEWQFVFVLRKTNLCAAVYGVSYRILAQ